MSVRNSICFLFLGWLFVSLPPFCPCVGDSHITVYTIVSCTLHTHTHPSPLHHCIYMFIYSQIRVTIAIHFWQICECDLRCWLFHVTLWQTTNFCYRHGYTQSLFYSTNQMRKDHDGEQRHANDVYLLAISMRNYCLVNSKSEWIGKMSELWSGTYLIYFSKIEQRRSQFDVVAE